MTEIDKPVTRSTQHVAHGRKIIATLTPGGVRLRLAGTRQGGSVDYVTLWRWIETQDIAIKPRKS